MASRRPIEFSVELATEIATRVAEGTPLTKVCKQAGMPRLTTVYKWLSLHASFDQLMRRARADVADTFFAQAIDIAHEKCVDSTAVQRNRLRVDTLKWAASKMNPRRYGDTLAIGGSEELPPVQIEPLAGAKAIAFVLARAGHLLDRESPAAPPPVPAQRVAIEQLPPYRRVMAPDEPALHLDVDESAAEMGRIGDPRRVMPEPATGRQPLSRRVGNEPS
jgi:ribosomal protein S7